MFIRLLSFSALVFCISPVVGQDPIPSVERKKIQAVRTTSDIDIDGVLGEGAWQTAPMAFDFITLEPNPGKPASQRTEVRVLYDNTGIYIGALCRDTDPSGIQKELSERDDTKNTDWFGMFFDPYRSGINALGFMVTTSGVQVDFKFGPNGDDNSWDAVWESATSITPEGWIAEFKIPYAALRFPETDVQTWYINFAREIRRIQETSFWNPINPAIAGVVNQSGLLEGISGIRSPFRLQATPFIAGYAQNYRDKSTSPTNATGQSFNGGMDIKYGINDAFTLDMTLVPDFGEAQSDNQVLNLTPFEVRFDENRQFFTEGAEIFNKGGIFYSRRIGGRPLHYSRPYQNLAPGERVVENPQQAQLINATKISGRNGNGLGLGFFNATAAPSKARIEGIDGSFREVETNPLTNYNVFILDQNLKNNSFVSFANTTVMRNGSDYDANVSGFEFDLRDKKNAVSLGGSGRLSQKYYPGDTRLGYAYTVEAGKISGNFNVSAVYNVESDTYDPNDLGFLLNPNERSLFTRMNYQVFKPFWKFNRAQFGFNTAYQRLYNPDVFTKFNAETWAWGQFKNFWNVVAWVYTEPVGSWDYFEPRTPGRYLRLPGAVGTGLELDTDVRKRLQLSVEASYIKIDEPGRQRVELEFSPRFRVNDRLNFRWQLSNSHSFNNVGYAAKVTRDIPDPQGGAPQTVQDVILGYRDVTTIENVFNINYSFSARMTLSMRTRHNWTKLHYLRFTKLESDGSLGSSDYNANHDANFNAFNVDMVYRWRFAPGSDLFFIWKNSILSVKNTVAEDYAQNLTGLFELPQSNSLSLKVIYFLDYASLMRRS